MPGLPPLAKAEASSEEIPPPANGKTYTPEELANPGTFTRPVLMGLLRKLGGDPSGLMAYESRTAILQTESPADVGTCDFTGEDGVAVETITVDGDEYSYGPTVKRFLVSKKAKTEKSRVKWIQKLIDEEVEL